MAAGGRPAKAGGRSGSLRRRRADRWRLIDQVHPTAMHPPGRRRNDMDVSGPSRGIDDSLL